MNVMICRCCGAHIGVAEGAESAVCKACGTRNTVAADEGGELLRRANMQRLSRDYVGAERSYLRVLSADPACHEALFGVVLCRYGVEFVEGQPVVHFLWHGPMRKDPDFRRACEAAPEETRAQYEATARQVDAIMENLSAGSAKAPHYDVFLCCKVTRPDGDGYSEDCARARCLYHTLTANGLRVYFVPESLPGPGVDYDAAHLQALTSARTMLLVCSDPENLDNSWIRSEWTGFLEMMDAGQDKRLIPLLYGDMRIDQLPGEINLRRLQALDMRLPDAEKTLIRALR